MILGAALLCLAGCDKTVTTTMTTPQHLKLDLTINNQMAPATKSVKTDWADGDKVYVLFGVPQDHPTPAYLTLTRNGSSWTETWTEGLEAEIAATTSGTLTAFFSPIDIDHLEYYSYIKGYLVFGENYCFALACDNAPYTVSAGVLSATMDLTLTEDHFVQLFLPMEAANAANLTFSSAKIMKSAGAGIIRESGEVGSANVEYSEPIPGFAFDGGVIFSGILDPEISGKETDYTFTIVDNKGTPETSDDVTYTLTKTATISQKDAILLPALSEWTILPEVVDLGLPSGLKWATCNLGASSPEEYGDYFAWGETEPKSAYKWSNYKWMQEGKSDWNYITRYTVEDGMTEGIWYSGDTFIGDGKRTLGEYDYSGDAVRAALGGEFRMPLIRDWAELREQCTYVWTDDYAGTGVAGAILTGPNGNAIFLPAAGSISEAGPINVGSSGDYWSMLLDTSNSSKAGAQSFRSAGSGSSYADRYRGLSVRAVCY